MGRGQGQTSATAGAAVQLLHGRRLVRRDHPSKTNPQLDLILAKLQRGQALDAIRQLQKRWSDYTPESLVPVGQQLALMTCEALADDYTCRELLADAGSLIQDDLATVWIEQLGTLELPAPVNKSQEQEWLRPYLLSAVSRTYARILADPTADLRPVLALVARLPESGSLVEKKLLAETVGLRADPVQLPELACAVTTRFARMRGRISHVNFRERTNHVALIIGVTKMNTERLVQPLHPAGGDDRLVHIATDASRKKTYCGLTISEAAPEYWNRLERGSWDTSRNYQLVQCSGCAPFADQAPETEERHDWSALGEDGVRQALNTVSSKTAKGLRRLTTGPNVYVSWRNFQAQISRELDRAAAEQLAEKLLAHYGTGEQAWRRLLPYHFQAEQWPELDQATVANILAGYQPSRNDPVVRMRHLAEQVFADMTEDLSR